MTKYAPIITAFAAVGALLVSGGAFGVSLYNATQINTIHVSINSRMSELLRLTEEAYQAKGLKQGRDEKK